MRKKPSPSMMQPTSFTDFNPLDVLAAAASLQRRTADDQSDEGDTDGCQTGTGAADEGEEEDDGQNGTETDGTPSDDTTATLTTTSDETSHGQEETPVPQEEEEEEQDKDEVFTSCCPVASPPSIDSVPVVVDAPKEDSINVTLAEHGAESPARDGGGGVKPDNSPASEAAVPDTDSKRPEATCQARTPSSGDPGGEKPPGAANKSNKPQMIDHSYAFVCQLQNLKTDEDEGYSSRSSLDDDSEEVGSRLGLAKSGSVLLASRRTNGAVSRLVMGAAATAADVTRSQQQQHRPCVPPARQTTAAQKLPPSPAAFHPPLRSSRDPSTTAKIMIVSKDSRLQRLMSAGISVVNSSSLTVAPAAAAAATVGIGSGAAAWKSDESDVLRTLLGPDGDHNATTNSGVNDSKVVIAGGLSGRVINVLKSGKVSLAPPSDSHLGLQCATSETAAARGSSEQPQPPSDTEEETTMTTETPPSRTHSSSSSSAAQGEEEEQRRRDAEGSGSERSAGEAVSGESGPQHSSAVCDQQGQHPETTTGSSSSSSNREGDQVGHFGSVDPNKQDLREHHHREEQREEESVSGQLLELVTEDDASCDSNVTAASSVCSNAAKGESGIAVDTTPLMSPVCERDTSMMSPMIGSPDILCGDLFKLPAVIGGVKQLPPLTVREDVTVVGCVINEPTVSDDSENSPTSGSNAEPTDVCASADDDTPQTGSPCRRQVQQQQQDEAEEEEEGGYTSPTSPDLGSSAAPSDGDFAETTSRARRSDSSSPQDDEQAAATAAATASTSDHSTSGHEHLTKDGGGGGGGDPWDAAVEPRLLTASSTDDVPAGAGVGSEGDLSVPPNVEAAPESADLVGSTRHQYIIEDDESPVAKFGALLRAPVEEGGGGSSESSSALTTTSSSPHEASSNPNLNPKSSATSTADSGGGGSSRSPLPELTATASSGGGGGGGGGVKVLVTTDPLPKSMFTAVRRGPVVTAIKTVSGANLHMVPVMAATSSKATTAVTSAAATASPPPGVMRVMPVGGAARSVVTQIIPKAGSFVNGVPVLGGGGGKTAVMLPEQAASKARMSTLLVPVSMTAAAAAAATASSHGGPRSLVQTVKTTSAAAAGGGGGALSVVEPVTRMPVLKTSTTGPPVVGTAATPSLKPQRKDVSSPLLFHHGRLTPLSMTTSDTSELLSSPENSLQGGFSGVIRAAGRQTPDHTDGLRQSARTSLELSKDKISFKISSNNLLESDDSMSSESGFSSKKESIGIGMMGSLSWKSIEAMSPRPGALTPIGTGTSGGREFIRIQGSEVRTGVRVSEEDEDEEEDDDDEDAMPPLEKASSSFKSRGAGRGGKMSAIVDASRTPTGKALHAYSRKRRKLALDGPAAAAAVAAGLPMSVVGAGSDADVTSHQTARLHPLIDHDYCMFTEFNAQVQSSIIATTESKTKVEKKYSKKTKAVRTKAVRGLITEDSMKIAAAAAATTSAAAAAAGAKAGPGDKLVGKGRRGRFKRRRVSKEKSITDEELSLDGTEELLDEGRALTHPDDKPKKAGEAKVSRTSERRAKLQALRDSKNYVKITGSYQDEFVYFATKNKRNRPRKSLEDAKGQLTKQPQVGGITVFDWYKDLSKADKSSRFGTPTTSGPSSPVPLSFTSAVVDGECGGGGGSSATPPSIPPVAARQTPSAPASTTQAALSTAGSLPDGLAGAFRPAATPLHDSEVADLVCDLSEINSLAPPADTAAGGVAGGDIDLSSFMMGGSSGDVVCKSEEPSAEQVRDMLMNMGEEELAKLASLSSSFDPPPPTSGMTDTSFDNFLGGFTGEEAPVLGPQPPCSNNLCDDLDEINDSDLLQSDLGHSMTSIIGEVKSAVVSSAGGLKPPQTPAVVAATTAPQPAATAAAAAAAVIPAPAAPAVTVGPAVLMAGQTETAPVSSVSNTTQEPTTAFSYQNKTTPFSPLAAKLDKADLFPDIVAPLSTIAPPSTSTTTDVSALAAHTAPELTVVSMYWNDLPGLVILGQQYVRLVDIHKQVLPAKDTGILKKRCQMMGLPIANCSELQRDFLVRYANAAKSKSTVIVAKDAAQTLIGFYVEPKSRASRQAAEERGLTLAEQARTQQAATTGQGGTARVPQATTQAEVRAEAARAHTTSTLYNTDSTPNSTAITNLRHATAVSAHLLPLTTAAHTPTGLRGRAGAKGSRGGGVARKRRRLTSGGSDASSPGQLSSSPAVSPGLSPGSMDVKRSARLRHKKVCYSDMLLGNHYDHQDNYHRRDKEESGQQSPSSEGGKSGTPLTGLTMNGGGQLQPPPPPGGRSADSATTREEEEEEALDDAASDDHENKETQRLLFPEDIEIKKLRVKMRKKCLSPKEKRRLRRLREKVRKREMKRKLRERRKFERLNGNRKKAIVAKTKRKLHESQQLLTRKYNQEHCYAAAPESPTARQEQLPPRTAKPPPLTGTTGNTNISSVDLTEIMTNGGSVADGARQVLLKEQQQQTVMEDEATAADVGQEAPQPSGKERNQPTQATRSQDTTTLEATSAAAAAAAPPSTTAAPSEPAAAAAVASVEVLHRDAAQRQSGRSRWQSGELFVSLYTAREAACVRCATCAELLSVKRFLKHMHHHNKRDELAHVTLSQTLQLAHPDTASDAERAAWVEFEDRRAQWQLSAPTPRRPGPPQATAPHTRPVVTPTGRKPPGRPPKTRAPPGDSGKKKELAAVVAVAVAGSGVVTAATSPGTTTPRHSTRVRKQKQLHPIERYVFSSVSATTSGAEQPPPVKRTRTDSSGETPHHVTPPSPARKVRLRLSTDAKGTPTTTKYGLRGQTEAASSSSSYFRH